MTTLSIDLTTSEASALKSWCKEGGYKNTATGVVETLKLLGAIPKEEDYWKKRFH